MTLQLNEENKMLLIGSISTRLERVEKIIELFKDFQDPWTFEYYTQERNQLINLQKSIYTVC
jgi:hypothetical protein